MNITPLAPSIVFTVPKNAMTWTTLNYIKTWDGQKAYALVGTDIMTNAYVGDTPNTEFLPILCIKKANLLKPGVIPDSSTTPGGAERGTWSGAYIDFTPPYQGHS